MTCGVYQIRNKINNKLYIGSSKNIEARWRSHVKKNTNPHLNSAIRKYGKENFEFAVLVECSEEMLLNREQYYLDEYEPHHFGYNKSGVAGRVEITDKERKRRSDFAKLHVPVNFNGHSLLGVPKALEHRIKIGLSHKGVPETEEAIQNNSLSHSGKTASEETKMKMSESHKESSKAIAQRAKLHVSLIGNQHVKGKHWKWHSKDKDDAR